MPVTPRDEVAVISEPVEEPFPDGDDIDPDVEAAWAQVESTSPGSASSEVDEREFIPPPPPSDETTPDDTDDGDLLDQRYKIDFDGLVFLGYLSDEFEIGGHRFTIHTLNTDALLEVALWTQKWSGSLGESRAYSTAVVAAAVELLDDRPLHRPMNRKEADTDFAMRVAVVRRWYPWTIDQVYSRVRELEQRVDELLAELGKASS